MSDHAIREDILTAYEYSYRHDDWVNPLEDTLQGITVEEALWRFAPEHKNIWETVLHMAVWTENIVERVQTGKHVRPSEGDWPPIPSIANGKNGQMPNKSY